MSSGGGGNLVALRNVSRIRSARALESNLGRKGRNRRLLAKGHPLAEYGAENFRAFCC